MFQFWPVYRKGSRLIFRHLDLGYIHGNVNEPRDASGASGKSSLFFLTVISSENADDRGSSLSGEAVRRLEKRSSIWSVRCGTNRP